MSKFSEYLKKVAGECDSDWASALRLAAHTIDQQALELESLKRTMDNLASRSVYREDTLIGKLAAIERERLALDAARHDLHRRARTAIAQYVGSFGERENEAAFDLAYNWESAEGVMSRRDIKA